MSRREDFLGIRPFERHSLVLVVAGTVYFLNGLVQFLAEPSPSREAALYYADRTMDYHYWGLVFMTAGILAIVSARWPPVSETWGYTVMTGLATAWSSFFIAGVLFHGTDPVNLGAGLIWGLVGFIWWAISGLVNPGAQSSDSALNENRAHHEENVALRKELNRVQEEG